MRSRTGAGTLLTRRRARVGSRGRDLAYPRVSAVRAPHLNTMRHAEGKAQVEHQQHGAMWQAQAVGKERSRPASDTDKAAPQAGTAMLLPHDPQVLCQQATLPPLTSGAWCRLSGVDQEPPSASRLVSPWPPVNHKHYMTCGSEMAHASGLRSLPAADCAEVIQIHNSNHCTSLCGAGGRWHCLLALCVLGCDVISLFVGHALAAAVA